jgi:hypothetical protein
MYTPPRPVSPPRNKALLPCGIACGCLLLIVIIIGALTVKVYRSGSSGMQKAAAGAEKFLTTLEKPDNKAAFDLMSSRVHAAKTVENVTDVMEMLATRHGHPVSHRQLPEYYMGSDNGVTSVRLAYQETFEKGEMPVQIVLVSEAGQWRVLSFNFQP